MSNLAFSSSKHSIGTDPYRIPQVSCQIEDDIDPEFPDDVFNREYFLPVFHSPKRNNSDLINTIKMPIKPRLQKKHSSNWADRLYVPKTVRQMQREKFDKLRSENEMREFTGKPQINPNSAKIFNSITKMFEWEKKKEIQKYQLLEKVQEERQNNEENMRKGVEICEGSRKYLEKNGRLNSKERIEIGLLRRAKEYFFFKYTSKELNKNLKKKLKIEKCKNLFFLCIIKLRIDEEVLKFLKNCMSKKQKHFKIIKSL